MRNLVYILLSLLLLTACSSESDTDVMAKKEVTIKLFSLQNQTKVIDDDNLESEQTIKSISVFFTEPSSRVVTHKYINSGFTTVDDYRVVSIPLEPSELKRKDIYVVTNYGNASFNSVTTLDDLEKMTTPAVNKTNNLNPANGLCMYGYTLDFNFENETNSPAIVYAIRTCAKYRVTLSFPENPTLSTNNNFVITGAANYTYIVDNTGNTIPSSAYFDFAAPITLNPTEVGTFTNLTYVYEAPKAPLIYLYTHINNSSAAQEYSAALPIPSRNYLYDINIKVYEDNATKSFEEGVSSSGSYRFEMDVKTYNEYGNRIN